jgi:hypothetical protein
MRLLTFGALLALLSLYPASAQTKCSSATIRGVYSFSFSGQRILDGGIPLHFASSGKMKGDGTNRLTVKDTSSIHGAIIRRTYEGILNMQEDCTGTASFTVSATEVAHYDVVASPDGSELHFIQTDSGTVACGSYKRDAGTDETVITPGSGVIGPPR